jgi:hypothetical protein
LILLVKNVLLEKGLWTKVSQGHMGKFNVTQHIEEKSNFNIFSSPELKAQVSYSDRPLSVVRLSVSLSVCLSVCL